MKLVDIKYFEHKKIDEQDTVTIGQLTRCFMLYVLRRTIFNNTSETIHFSCLQLLRTQLQLGRRSNGCTI